jgi:hypothetical protein
MPVSLKSSGGGSVTMDVPSTASTFTLTLPASTATVATTTGTLTNPTINGFTGDTSVVNIGSGQIYKDSSGNVGIGTSSPTNRLDVTAATGVVNVSSSTGTNYAKLQCNNAGGSYQFGIDNSAGANFGSGVAYARVIWNDSASAPTILYTNSAERMRIDSSGNVLVGTTSQGGSYNGRFVSATGSGLNAWLAKDTQNNGAIASFVNNSNALAGTITISGTTTTYGTSSDYRLKENVQQITTGLATIGELRPVTYDWKADKSKGEGFIAHELQEVIPQAVTGIKDAVNEDGSIKPQGVDYSKIVVHLVAAIQELKADLDAAKAEIATLKGAA